MFGRIGKKTKRLAAVLMAAVFFTEAAGAHTAFADVYASADEITFEDVKNGRYGEDITWRIEDDTLIFEGTGEMLDALEDSPYNGFFSTLSFKRIRVGEGITSVGFYAFRQCGELESIELPSTLYQISSGAFYQVSVDSFSIANGVSYIWSLPNAKTIHFPASVKYAEGGEWWDTHVLTSITVDEANETYQSVDGVLFTKDGKTLVRYPCARKEDYVIPDGVDIIAEDAFKSVFLRSEKPGRITFPDSLTMIEDGAFRFGRLNAVDLPSGLEWLGQGVFEQCDIKELVIPSGLRTTNTGIAPFQKMKIENLIIEDGRKKLPEMFADCSIRNIEIPASLQVLCVSGIDKEEFTVPKTVKEVSVSGTFQKLIISEGVSCISKVWKCPNLTDVSIPDTVTYLKSGAFTHCRSLKRLEVPESVIRIHDGVFLPKKGYYETSFDCSGLEGRLKVVAKKGSSVYEYAQTHGVNFIDEKTNILHAFYSKTPLKLKKKVYPNKVVITYSPKNPKGVYKYQIRIREAGTDKWKKLSTTKKKYTFKDLKKGKTYDYQLRAFVNNGKIKYIAGWGKTVNHIEF